MDTNPARTTSPDQPTKAPSSNRPIDQPDQTADLSQAAPQKITNQHQSKITQFIDQARQDCDTRSVNHSSEYNGGTADPSVVASDPHSAEADTDSSHSQEDEFVSAEYSEYDEDTLTAQQSELSAESPEPGKTREQSNQVQKRKQKPKKKNSKKK